MDWLKAIYNSFCNNQVYYTSHAKSEMENEEFGNIYDFEVLEAIENGEIIQEYLNDKPYPSFLIYGKTKSLRPLHAVCAFNEIEKLVFVVTVYQPDPDLWIDYKERRK